MLEVETSKSENASRKELDGFTQSVGFTRSSVEVEVTCLFSFSSEKRLVLLSLEAALILYTNSYQTVPSGLIEAWS